MDIDSDASSSTTSNPCFVNDFEKLPASGPTGHAHIINTDQHAACMNEQSPINLQDAVATTLFNLSPDTLTSFLNPTVNTFKAVFGKRDTQLVVWRRGLPDQYIRTPRITKSLRLRQYRRHADRVRRIMIPQSHGGKCVLESKVDGSLNGQVRELWRRSSDAGRARAGWDGGAGISSGWGDAAEPLLGAPGGCQDCLILMLLWSEGWGPA